MLKRFIIMHHRFKFTKIQCIPGSLHVPGTHIFPLLLVSVNMLLICLPRAAVSALKALLFCRCVLCFESVLLLRSGRCQEYCDQLSECLCVCLSASMSLEPLDRSSGNVVHRSLWPWLVPPPASLRCVMYFRFYG